MEYQIISKEIIYGFCQPIAKGVIIGGSVVITIKLVIAAIFKFRRNKHCEFCKVKNHE